MTVNPIDESTLLKVMSRVKSDPCLVSKKVLGLPFLEYIVYCSANALCDFLNYVNFRAGTIMKLHKLSSSTTKLLS